MNRCRNILPLIVAVAVLLQACATPYKALITTGEVLDTVGKQFLATGKTYDALYDKGHITPQQYKAWADFAPKFQLGYQRAVDMWNVVRASADEQGKIEVRKLVDVLQTEILVWFIDSATRLQIVVKGGKSL